MLSPSLFSPPSSPLMPAQRGGEPADRDQPQQCTELDRCRSELARRGWTLLCQVPFLNATGRVDERAVLEFACAFGVPSARDGGRAIWPVTPGRIAGASFSGRAGRAGFHTDAQYRDNPEDFVCLFAARPALDGGRTLLLSFDGAVEAVQAADDGGLLLAAMERPEWRWTVPVEFGAAPEREPGEGKAATRSQRLSAPAAVLPGNGRIRWRGDNLAATPRSVSPAIAERLDGVFDAAPGQVEIVLDRGDVVVLDNHTVMHARTAFQDPRRLLLRVRLWESLR